MNLDYEVQTEDFKKWNQSNSKLTPAQKNIILTKSKIKESVWVIFKTKD